MNGALLLHKHAGVTSFGILELLQKQLLQRNPRFKRKDLSKLGHGGTLDPFATGLLIVLVGKGVKLSRYFLGSPKTYQGEIRFGASTLSGDPTLPISETSDCIPDSLQKLRELAHQLTLQPYLQTPPMYSAKKQAGKPLYELARAGVEVERQPKLCQLFQFEILSYNEGHASFQVSCSSGTYIRTLAQDFAKAFGTVAHLNSLCRTASGSFQLDQAWSVQQISDSPLSWDQLPCWISFDRLLDGFHRAEATQEERQALIHGQQNVLTPILSRMIETPPSSFKVYKPENIVAIYTENALIGIAKREENNTWGIERVFT